KVPAEVLADLDTATLYAVRIGTLTDNKIDLAPAAWTGLNQVWSLRIASHGKAITLTSGNPFGNDDKQRIAELWLITPSQQPGAQLLAKNIAIYPDWTADGTSVIYCKTALEDDSSDKSPVGLIVRQPVC